jgi:hypothetical protein
MAWSALAGSGKSALLFPLARAPKMVFLANKRRKLVLWPVNIRRMKASQVIG